MKTFVYFQPEYVNLFRCTGGGCLKSCCKDWTITIDRAIYKKYRQIKPKDTAKEILSHLKFDAKQDSYVVKLDEKLFCPFLTEDSLCRLQRDYGEEFLSVTCSTYPRRTYAVGKIFERSLTLTCPAAAETVLFAKAYQSEEFLLTEILPVVETFVFDANDFIKFIITFTGHTLEQLNTKEGRKFLVALQEVLGIKPDENNLVSLPEIAANYERLADARKNFLEKYSPFLENYLVNELFYSMYPWRFMTESLTKNFAVFLISFKIFELITFATVQSGLNLKEDLLLMVNWFMTTTNHNNDLYKRFFELLAGIDDTYLLMAVLL